MGLPDKIKKTLTPFGSAPEIPNQSSTKKTSRGPLSKATHPIAEGLPSFKEPQLPHNRRAILVACASRRASWAVLRPSEEGHARRWRFERNLPAVPEPASATSPNTGSRRGSSGPHNDDTDAPETSIEGIDLGGYACGVCGADGSFGNLFIRCGHCHTLQCQPAQTWQCPGCGPTLGEQPMQDMASLSTSRGAPPSAKTSLGSSKPYTAIGQSRALSSRNRRKDS